MKYDRSSSMFSAGVQPAPAFHGPTEPFLQPAERYRPPSLYRGAGKRLFDIVFTLCVLPLVVPVVLVLALAVLTDGHAPFYRQQRLGRGGRVYKMWKLRSMVPDADAALKDHLAQSPKARLEWQDTQKLKGDPRVTPVGRFLRSTSLDELPQFWNVLKGDMSVVGPRPMMLHQKALYGGGAYWRLRPGITGPWQVSARNDASFAGRAAYDDAYEREMTFGRDVKIIAATLVVVAACTGY